MLDVTKYLSYRDLFKVDGYKAVRKKLYKDYIMKKYLNVNSSEIRKNIENGVLTYLKKEKDALTVLKKINQKIKDISYLDLYKQKDIDQIKNLSL